MELPPEFEQRGSDKSFVTNSSSIVANLSALEDVDSRLKLDFFCNIWNRKSLSATTRLCRSCDSFCILHHQIRGHIGVTDEKMGSCGVANHPWIVSLFHYLISRGCSYSVVCLICKNSFSSFYSILCQWNYAINQAIKVNFTSKVQMCDSCCWIWKHQPPRYD